MTTEIFTEKLRTFAAKAGCSSTQYEAEQLFDELKSEMTYDQLLIVLIAWDRFQIGKDRGELDELCRRISNLQGPVR